MPDSSPLATLAGLLPSPPGVRDEPNASRLCSRRPPYGLISEGVLRKEAASLAAGLNATPPAANSTVAELCALFFERLSRATVAARVATASAAVASMLAWHHAAYLNQNSA